MPPFRNPFGRKVPPVSGTPISQDENPLATATNGAEDNSRINHLSGSRTSSALSIKPNKEEPNEFKLSGILSQTVSAMKWFS